MSAGRFVIKRPVGNHRIGDGSSLMSGLTVELTERCNNNCVHCYINRPEQDTQAQSRELSTAEMTDILHEATSLGCLGVRFTGGEPLLREDFIDLYLAARRLGLNVVLFTNAILITPELARLFSRIPPREPIEVTLYGMSEESYAAVSRVTGSFEAAWRGLELLRAHEVPHVVKWTVLPQNKRDVPRFEEWVKSNPWMAGNHPRYSQFLDLRARGEEDHNRLIHRLRPSPEDGMEILARQSDYAQENIEFLARFAGPPGDRLFTCSGGMKECLDAYGFLQPCLMLRTPGTAYDLRKGSLREALTEFFPRVRELRAENPDYLARCARCFLKALCEQCPAKSWAEHGALDTPVEYLCDVAHIQARYLGVLADTEKAWDVEDWRERLDTLARRI